MKTVAILSALLVTLFTFACASPDNAPSHFWSVSVYACEHAVDTLGCASIHAEPDATETLSSEPAGIDALSAYGCHHFGADESVMVVCDTATFEIEIDCTNAGAINQIVTPGSSTYVEFIVDCAEVR